MTGIWQRLVPQRHLQSFFTMPLLQWLFHNLSVTDETEGSPWATLFAVSVWWSWKWRCGDIFGGMKQCRDRVSFLKELAKEIYQANQSIRGHGRQVQREERQITWSSPTSGWIKINTDGASHENPGLATAGGALRDENGSWIGGFSLNIEICFAPLAELWGVYYGLCIAWDKGITWVELEVDSEIVVGFLTAGISDSHPLSFLARLCYGFLWRDWLVRIRHVYRETNRLADGLTNYAFSLPLGLNSFDFVPDLVNSLCKDDKEGLAFARQVRL